MIFTRTPFDLTFLLKEYVKDGSDHLFILVYAFRSTDTRLRYIVRAECHKEEVFAIKFYAKNHKQSDYKYSLITNKGHTTRIFLTCAQLVPKLLPDYPDASFGLVGSRSIDLKNDLIEPVANNRRFKIYTKVILELFGDETFEHYAYPEISGYLLINRKNNIESSKKNIETMFFDNYRDIHSFDNL